MANATRTGRRISVRDGSYTVDLYVFSCPNCGIIFGVPDEWDDWRRADHGSIYCPNGHSCSYSGPTKAEKDAKAQRERAEAAERQAARLGALLDQETAALQSERHRARALKGHMTRMRNRIANGVCPVPGCKRVGFSNVMRHIASQHPDWHHEHEHELA